MIELIVGIAILTSFVYRVCLLEDRIEKLERRIESHDSGNCQDLES